MAVFRFLAMDAGGSEVEGEIEAEGQAQAIAQIRARGLFPTRVMGADATGKRRAQPGRPQGTAMLGGAKRSRLPRLFRGRVRPKQLMVFTRQLATLVAAGLPLLRGLRILLKQERSPLLREAITGMGESVEGGSTFSEALSLYPSAFDTLFVNMVKAGEAGGVLDTVLSRLAEFMEKAEKVKNRVRSAMIYPIVVLIAALSILVFLMVKIIPRFAEIFSSVLGRDQLPGLTQFVINISNFVANRWYVGLIVILLVAIAVRIALQTAKGRRLFDRMKLHVPVFGTLVSKAAIARLSRTLGTLLNSGVPVLQALNIVRDTCGNEIISDAVQHVHDSVKEGESMAQPMESSGAFPAMVVSMVDVGEETGALPDMLLRVADNYDDEVDTAVEGLTSIIEPFMIIFLALIIGTIVIAMFVPLITLMSGISK